MKPDEPNIKNLVTFLYILGRDHLSLGKVVEIQNDHIRPIGGGDVTYTNRELADWARRVAEEILYQ